MNTQDQTDALFRAIKHRFTSHIKGLFCLENDTPVAAYILENDTHVMLVSIKILFVKKPSTLVMSAFTHYLNKTYADTFVWIDFTPGTPALIPLMTQCGWRRDGDRVILDLGENKKEFTVPVRVSHWELNAVISINTTIKDDFLAGICESEYWSPIGGSLSVNVSGDMDFRYWYLRGFLSPETKKPSVLLYGIMTPLGTFYIFQSFLLMTNWDNDNVYALFYKARNSLKEAYESYFQTPKHFNADFKLAIWSEDFLEGSNLNKSLLMKMRHEHGFKIICVDDFVCRHY